MLNHSNESDFLIFNPDTLWQKNYLKKLSKWRNYIFLKKPVNILLLVNKKLSFDKNLSGDFDLENNLNF